VDSNRDPDTRDVQQFGEMLKQQDSRIFAEGGQTYHGVNLFEERDRQRQQLGRELQELDREISNSAGYRLRNKMGLLGKSYFVFDVNYLNLKHILAEFEQPVIFRRLWEEKNRERFELFMNDVIRLFHNYVAGAATLLDHIRTLQGDAYLANDSSNEYRARWDEQLRDSSLPQFVEDLLAHMLHEGLPLAVAELNFGGGSGVEVNSSIKLDAVKLAKWERWSKQGREYLSTLNDKVRLDGIVEGHAAVVADFYQWFVTRQTESHQQAMRELEGLEEKRRHLRQRIENLEDVLEAAEKTTISVREERDKLAKELEAERQYREWDKERADRLEAHLERELNKGFFRRMFGR
jgi:DNA-binding transcriptional regulator GbsR (MarR family)